MADYLYGLNAVKEALNGKRALHSLLVLRGENKPRLQEIIELAVQTGVAIKKVERAELTQKVGDVGHQGVVAQLLNTERVVALEWLLEQIPSGQRFFLVLDEVTDPYNFGALIRSAAAAGCQAVIVGKDRSCPLTAVVEKAAAGAVAHVALCRVTNLARALEDLKAAGVWVYGLAGEESRCLYDVDLAGDVALVAGSEGKGLRPLVRKSCDAVLAIPMPGVVQSLNVSVASGIALFEVVRQRQSRKT